MPAHTCVNKPLSLCCPAVPSHDSPLGIARLATLDVLVKAGTSTAAAGKRCLVVLTVEEVCMARCHDDHGCLCVTQSPVDVSLTTCVLYTIVKVLLARLEPAQPPRAPTPRPQAPSPPAPATTHALPRPAQPSPHLLQQHLQQVRTGSASSTLTRGCPFTSILNLPAGHDGMCRATTPTAHDATKHATNNMPTRYVHHCINCVARSRLLSLCVLCCSPQQHPPCKCAAAGRASASW